MIYSHLSSETWGIIKLSSKKVYKRCIKKEPLIGIRYSVWDSSALSDLKNYSIALVSLILVYREAKM